MARPKMWVFVIIPVIVDMLFDGGKVQPKIQLVMKVIIPVIVDMLFDTKVRPQIRADQTSHNPCYRGHALRQEMRAAIGDLKKS